MPIKRENRQRYPADWPAIAADCIARAGYRCEKCGAVNGQPHPVTGSLVRLAAAHLDHQPENCAPENLCAMCQRCHLRYDRHHHRACPHTPDLFAGAA